MRLVDEILVRCQELVNEEEVEEAAALRYRVECLERTVNEQKQTIDLLMTRVEKLERQLDTSVTVVTTVSNTVTTAAVVTTVASTGSGTTTTTTTPALVQQQQRASYLNSYRYWCRQACLVAGLEQKPIPGRDILLKPNKSYKCFHPDCSRSLNNPINGYILHLKVVHGVNIREQSMTSTTRNNYLPTSE